MVVHLLLKCSMDNPISCNLSPATAAELSVFAICTEGSFGLVLLPQPPTLLAAPQKILFTIEREKLSEKWKIESQGGGRGESYIFLHTKPSSTSLMHIGSPHATHTRTRAPSLSLAMTYRIQCDQML